MSIESDKTPPAHPPATPINSGKPNELGGVYFSSHIRITDPNTKEVLVQIRGDN